MIIFKMVKTQVLSYKKMIIKELNAANIDSEKSYISSIKLKNQLIANFKLNIKHSNRRVKRLLRNALAKLVDDNTAVRKRNSYRLSTKFLSKIVVKPIKVKRTIVKPIKVKKIKKSPIQIAAIPKIKKIKKVKKAKQILPLVTSINFFNNIPSFSIPLIAALPKTKKTNNYEKRHPATWQYNDPNNVNAQVKSEDGWYDYDYAASDIVEDEWQRYIVNRGMNDVRAVKSGNWEYMVDFGGWKQTNILHQDHRSRSVRRLDENSGVTKNPYY